MSRFLGTSPALSKTVQNAEKTSGASQEENLSFVMNIFRGQIEPKQIFPFPNTLTEEQRDTLTMLVDPVSKFFEVSVYIKFYLVTCRPSRRLNQGLKAFQFKAVCFIQKFVFKFSVC